MSDPDLWLAYAEQVVRHVKSIAAPEDRATALRIIEIELRAHRETIEAEAAFEETDPCLTDSPRS